MYKYTAYHIKYVSYHESMNLYCSTIDLRFAPDLHLRSLHCAFQPPRAKEAKWQGIQAYSVMICILLFYFGNDRVRSG